MIKPKGDDTMDEKKESNKVKKALAVAGTALITFFGAAGDTKAEAANVPPPSDGKRIVSTQNQKEDFNKRISVRADNKGIHVTVKREPKAIDTLKKIKVQPANIRCATPEENQKVTELNQRKSDLFRDRAKAKQENNMQKVEEINIEVAKISIEIEEVLKPVRERQAANPEPER